MKHSDWSDTGAAIWRGRHTSLRPVRRLDPVRLEDLLGIDDQKAAVLMNTRRFLDRDRANNMLLWGARGTGKSSLVKALLNYCFDDGLRLIEVDRDEITDLPEILDRIRELEFRFLLYCDDLSFEAGEHGYRALKSALEGTIEAPPENVLVCATSNRRHLLPESMRDNLDTEIVDGELHYNDTVEERLSLSERFGLQLAFHPFNRDQYLDIIRKLTGNALEEGSDLHREAVNFARHHGTFSGRCARHFVHAHF